MDLMCRVKTQASKCITDQEVQTEEFEADGSRTFLSNKEIECKNRLFCHSIAYKDCSKSPDCKSYLPGDNEFLKIMQENFCADKARAEPKEKKLLYDYERVFAGKNIEAAIKTNYTPNDMLNCCREVHYSTNVTSK